MMWSEEDRSVVRRFGKPVAAACLVAALLGTAYLWHVRSNPTLSFRSLSVKNADGIQVTTRQVGAVVEKSVSGNFFTADLGRVKEAVETLPWVASATVRRVFPDRLIVEVERHKALALYEDGRIVSDRGVLFAANPEEAGESRLPVFYGPEQQVSLMTEAFVRLSDVLAPLSVRITDFQISDRASWSLVFSGEEIPPTQVELGRDDEGLDSVAKRLGDFVKVYDQVRTKLGGPPASVDLRYAKAFAASNPDENLIRAWREKGRDGQTQVPAPISPGA